jgi:transcriptional regulator with XRE-family HTH domain
MNVIGKQVTAARALLGWTMQELADQAGVSLTSVQRFENSIGDSRTEVKTAICETLQKSGIDFADGGVRPRISNITIFEGPDSYLRILDDIFYTLKDTGGEALFSCVDDRKSPIEVIESYRRIRKTGIQMRSLIEEGNTFLMGELDEYRYIPKKYFYNHPQVIYGNKIATMIYGIRKQSFVVENANMAAAQKNLFEYAWVKSKKPKKNDAPIRY